MQKFNPFIDTGIRAVLYLGISITCGPQVLVLERSLKGSSKSVVDFHFETFSQSFVWDPLFSTRYEALDPSKLVQVKDKQTKRQNEKYVKHSPLINS